MRASMQFYSAVSEYDNVYTLNNQILIDPWDSDGCSQREVLDIKMHHVSENVVRFAEVLAGREVGKGTLLELSSYKIM